jgi:hypothetical protein
MSIIDINEKSLHLFQNFGFARTTYGIEKFIHASGPLQSESRRPLAEGLPQFSLCSAR